MTWFKVDDGFYDHPKVIDLPLAAVGLWALAGAYCARHLTDGVITDRQIRAIGGTRKQAAALVAAGLWSADDAPPSARRYAFNDWGDFQPARADVEAKREEARERMAAARARKRKTSGNGEMFARTNGERSQEVRSDGLSERSHYPDPTRPDPTPITTNVVIKESAPAKPEKPKKNAYSPEFETWWKIYPNSSGKAAAETAWKKALKLMDGEELNNLTRHYARLVEARIVNPDYVPHGATWLNGRRWEDGVMQQNPTQVQATAPGRLSNAEVARQLQERNAQDAFADTHNMTNAEALQAWMQEQKAIGF